MNHKSELAGVAHNIAHHAGSGVSYISPHLAAALRECGQETTRFSLLADSPYPENAADNINLRRALKALHYKSISILETHGFSIDDVSNIELRATPVPWDKQGYTLHTRVVITVDARCEYDSGWIA